MVTEDEDQQRTITRGRERERERERERSGDVDSRIQVEKWSKMETTAQNRTKDGGGRRANGVCWPVPHQSG